MADVFQRLLGPAASLDPGQYTTVGGRISLRCPKCGAIDTLKHDIDPAGRVMRAYQCLTVTCGYREWIVFESWSPS